MSALQEDKDKSKSATKERFIRFYDLLEEVAERHRLAKVLHDDRVGRDTVCEEVVKLVVPSLQRFTQRNTGKEFSKSKLMAVVVARIYDVLILTITSCKQIRRNTSR